MTAWGCLVRGYGREAYDSSAQAAEQVERAKGIRPRPSQSAGVGASGDGRNC